MSFESTYKHKIHTMQTTLKKYAKDQEEADLIIRNQNQQINELKLQLKQEGDKINSFKDPDGCTQFAKVLQEFETNIAYLSKEKEK